MVLTEAAQVIIGVALGVWLSDAFRNREIRLIENKLRNINKIKLDTLNWLRSELSYASRAKLTKQVDEQKIALLEKIIKKLEK